MHAPRRLELEKNLTWLACALAITIMWLLVQGYHGLEGDAQIYAFQAWARLHPALAADLFLQDNSQDKYTIFSSFYALIISWFGVEDAARLLTLLFTLWLLYAAGRLAAAFASRRVAWFGVAALILIPTGYGGSSVFHFLEHFLTARLPAEAMVATAFACHASGKRTLGLIIASAAVFVHPLMALPCLLVLTCCWMPVRVSVIGAIAGCLSVVCVAIVAAKDPQLAHSFAIMDGPWLEVARERSQFLFLQLWSYHDWLLNARPFAYLIFLAVAIGDQRIRKLCIACCIVGATGIAIALISSCFDPVAILVQGQAWRWVWIGCLISALLTPLLISEIFKVRSCGTLCSLLLIAGWALPPFAGLLSAVLSLVIWILRPNRHYGLNSCFRAVTAFVLIALIAWVISNSVGLRSMPLDSMGNVIGARAALALLFWVGWRWLQDSRTPLTLACVAAAQLAIVLIVLPTSTKEPRTLGAAADVREFADWSNEISATSTVLVAPAQDVGAFVWFTLKRPNYLALDQSAGVVFSRTTALEIRRRSEVLLPLTDPTWKIWSGIKLKSGHGSAAPVTRPLTANALISICGDLVLGFVISPENVGIRSSTHTQEGAWKNWHLYDCSYVRANRTID
jgi:hypothetical protein